MRVLFSVELEDGSVRREAKEFPANTDEPIINEALQQWLSEQDPEQTRIIYSKMVLRS